MATKYKDGARQFSTDSDEVAKLAIEHGLFRTEKESPLRSLIKWIGALPLIGQVIRMLMGNLPNGP